TFADGRRRGVAPAAVHAEGAITAVGSGTVTVNGMTFTINAATKIRKADAAITAADLKVGDKVEVKGVVQSGANVATRIEVDTEAAEQPGDNEGAAANGIVASVGSGTLLVHTASGNDVTVEVSATTAIKKQGATMKLADIKVGDRVEAHGTRVDDH